MSGNPFGSGLGAAHVDRGSRAHGSGKTHGDPGAVMNPMESLTRLKLLVAPKLRIFRSAHATPIFHVTCYSGAPPSSVTFTCAHRAPCHSPADRLSTHFLIYYIFFLFTSLPFVFLTHKFPQIWIAGGDGTALVFDCFLVWGRSIAGPPHHGVRLMPFLQEAAVDCSGVFSQVLGAVNRLNGHELNGLKKPFLETQPGPPSFEGLRLRFLSVFQHGPTRLGWTLAAFPDHAFAFSLPQISLSYRSNMHMKFFLIAVLLGALAAVADHDDVEAVANLKKWLEGRGGKVRVRCILLVTIAFREIIHMYGPTYLYDHGCCRLICMPTNSVLRALVDCMQQGTLRKG